MLATPDRDLLPVPHGQMWHCVWHRVAKRADTV